MALDVGVFPSLVTFLGRESARSLHNLSPGGFHKIPFVDTTA